MNKKYQDFTSRKFGLIGASVSEQHQVQSQPAGHCPNEGLKGM
jgi:hypothetical protein